MRVEHGRTPEFQIEGHVFGTNEDQEPWLAHLILTRIRGVKVSTSLGRDQLAALLRFIATHDPDLYARMGVAADRARRTSK